MILGNSLLFALGAAGLGTLLYYVMTRLAINVWLCRWFALALASIYHFDWPDCDWQVGL
jgi:hypothetical protein